MADVVFNPSLAQGQNNRPRSRYIGFIGACKVGETVWSSKQDSEDGDLYLFWFGAPIQALVGIGLHTGNYKMDPTWGREGVFQPLVRLKNPVTLKDIHGDDTLASWWSGNPYRGMPKTMLKNPTAARRMLTLILDRNPSMRGLVAPYLAAVGDAAKAPTKPSKSESEAWDRLLAKLDVDSRERLRREVTRAVRDRKLRTRVLARWGSACAVCGTELVTPCGLLEVEVAHVAEVTSGGTDSPRNALPLCRTHHWAFDQHLWTVEPASRTVFVAASMRQHPVLQPYHERELRSVRPDAVAALDAAALKARMQLLVD